MIDHFEVIKDPDGTLRFIVPQPSELELLAIQYSLGKKYQDGWRALIRSYQEKSRSRHDKPSITLPKVELP